MCICFDFVFVIGNIFLICLCCVLDDIGCEILGKVEFMNFGQLVKDRVVLYIIKDVVVWGDLKFGGIIVEGMVGNIGIGLVLVGVLMGFCLVIVIFEM